jgi:hypothetical protein
MAHYGPGLQIMALNENQLLALDLAVTGHHFCLCGWDWQDTHNNNYSQEMS